MEQPDTTREQILTGHFVRHIVKTLQVKVSFESTKPWQFDSVNHFFSGNYTEALNDAKTATEVQPSFAKAFVRGMSIT